MTRLTVRMTASVVVAGLSVISFPLIRAGQQAATKPPSKLVTAKLICVTPMPDNLDQWILDDLLVWGKYKVTGDQEGADLVMRAYKPEREPRYAVGRQGVPEPKKERRQPVVTITVIDWVKNEALWQAEILDKKPKNEGSQPSNGPEVEIDARGLKPDQLAQKLTRKLRDYVDELEKSESGGKQ